MKERRRKDRWNPAGWGIMCDRGRKKRSVSNLMLRAPRRAPPNRVLSKAVANSQRRPREGSDSKINERLIYSIRLDPARLLGSVLFLIRCNSRQPDEMFGLEGPNQDAGPCLVFIPSHRLLGQIPPKCFAGGDAIVQMKTQQPDIREPRRWQILLVDRK